MTSTPAATTAPSEVSGRTRTCVGCGARVSPDDVSGTMGASPPNPRSGLVRLVLGPNGEVAVDAKGGAFGRGAHVHMSPDCLKKAAKSGLSKSMKSTVRIDASALAAAIVDAMDRRAEGLLAAAVRSSGIAIGADAVTGACRRGEAALVIVATDAAAAADLTEVRRAITEGRAIAWASKERLGAIVKRSSAAREGVAVVAIQSSSIAETIRAAVHAVDACRDMAQLSRPQRGQSVGDLLDIAKSDVERGA